MVTLLIFTACSSDDNGQEMEREVEQETIPIQLTPALTQTQEPSGQPQAESENGIRHYFTNLGFSVEFPVFWEGKFGVEEHSSELDNGTMRTASIYHKATRDELYSLYGFDFGGRIFTLGRITGEHFTYDYAPIMAGGSIFLAQTGGYTYFVNFPSGVEFNYDDPTSEIAAEYLEIIGHWEPNHWDFLTSSFRLTEPTATITREDQPTDIEIETLYQRAVEAFGWFHMTTMPLDMAYEVTDNGFMYWRVDFEGINTMADLEAYLSTIFIAEIVDELLADSRYREFGGVLYAIGADRGSNLTRGSEVHEIIRTTREHLGYSVIIYSVTVDVLNAANLEEVVGFEIYQFTLEYVDGAWLFRYFDLVR